MALVLVAFMSGAALAEGITCGIKGGLNLADLTGDGITGNETKMVFGGGIFFNYVFTEVISCQVEAIYMMKGAKSETLENTGINLSYIDIPVLAKLSVPTEGDFVPYCFAGPSFGILMSAKHEVLNTEDDIKDDLKSPDYGLVFGAGFDYKIGAGCLLVDARYTFSLATIMEDEDVDVKNSGIIFMAGYGHSF